MALDLSDDEDLGEFIYKTSHTAKLLREKKQKEDEDDMYKDTNTSNYPQPINIKEEAVKAEVRTEDEASTDDEHGPEYVSSLGSDPVKSEETDDEERSSAKPTTQSNASIQKIIDIQHTRKRRYRSKRKREEEESNGSVQKTAAHMICSVKDVPAKQLIVVRVGDYIRDIIFAVSKDAQTEFRIEEFAPGMVPRER